MNRNHLLVVIAAKPYSLDVLDRDEESHLEIIRQIVLPKAPEPIGIAGGTDEVKQLYSTRTSSSIADDFSLIIPPPPKITFWAKYQSKINELNEERDDARESDYSDFEQMSTLAQEENSLDNNDRPGDHIADDDYETNSDIKGKNRLSLKKDVRFSTEETSSLPKQYYRPALYSPIGGQFSPQERYTSTNVPAVTGTSSLLTPSMILTPSISKQVKPMSTAAITGNEANGEWPRNSNAFSPSDLSYYPRSRTSLSTNNTSLSFGLDTPTSRTG
jgi:hypothetical protein